MKRIGVEIENRRRCWCLCRRRPESCYICRQKRCHSYQTISGELPEGMRLWGCYVMAHEAYLNQQYEKSLGIVQACLALTGKIYPIAEIYLRLVAAMDAMSLRDQELARTYFMEAWELARPG